MCFSELSQYSVWLDWMTGVWSPAEIMDFSSSLFVQTSSEPPSLLSNGYCRSFSRGKRDRGMMLTTQLLSSAEVKNE
jgi:hypothetical protein